MANDFGFDVVARDRYSAVFDRLNRKAGEAVRPMANAQRVTQGIFRELKVTEVGKGFQLVSRSTREIASNLSSISGPASALFGMGSAGSIVGLAAAVAALTTKWAGLGFQVSRTAQGIGVSVEDLQRWRAMASLAGVSAEAMAAGMASLARTLQDAQFGRNPEALMTLAKLGINIKRNSAGVIDTVAALEDLSRAISRVGDPQIQRLIASGFGLEEALPLLRQGPDALRRLSEEANRLGMVQGPGAIKWAEDFTNSLNRLKGALEGVFNRMGARLAPAGISTMNAITGAINTPAVSIGSRGDFRTWLDYLVNGDPNVGSPFIPRGRTSTLSMPKPGDAYDWPHPEAFARKRPAVSEAPAGPLAMDDRARALRVELQINGAPPGMTARADVVLGYPATPAPCCRSSHVL